MPVRQVRGGVEVDGLSESIRALKRLDPLYRKEAVQVMRDAPPTCNEKHRATSAPAGAATRTVAA